MRVYRKDYQTLVVRGAVRDQKPAGLYVKGDPDPLTVHHMIVDMTVALPTLEIIAAKAVMEHHPYAGCPTITEHYSNLVGMSVARGYTHKVREIFGGRRVCSFVTPTPITCRLRTTASTSLSPGDRLSTSPAAICKRCVK